MCSIIYYNHSRSLGQELCMNQEKSCSKNLNNCGLNIKVGVAPHNKLYLKPFCES